jgi:hypothetical protein
VGEELDAEGFVTAERLVVQPIKTQSEGQKGKDDD